MSVLYRHGLDDFALKRLSDELAGVGHHIAD
jgi:hypothetical protein